MRWQTLATRFVVDAVWVNHSITVLSAHAYGRHNPINIKFWAISNVMGFTLNPPRAFTGPLCAIKLTCQSLLAKRFAVLNLQTDPKNQTPASVIM